MEDARDHLLADPGFTADEHRHVAPHRHPYFAVEGGEGGGGAGTIVLGEDQLGIVAPDPAACVRRLWGGRLVEMVDQTHQGAEQRFAPLPALEVPPQQERQANGLPPAADGRAEVRLAGEAGGTRPGAQHRRAGLGFQPPADRGAPREVTDRAAGREHARIATGVPLNGAAAGGAQALDQVGKGEAELAFRRQPLEEVGDQGQPGARGGAVHPDRHGRSHLVRIRARHRHLPLPGQLQGEIGILGVQGLGQQPHRPEAQDRARGNLGAVDPAIIEESAVGAAVILDHQAAAGDPQHGVPARYLGHRQVEVAGLRSADGVLAGNEVEDALPVGDGAPQAVASQQLSGGPRSGQGLLDREGDRGQRSVDHKVNHCSQLRVSYILLAPVLLGRWLDRDSIG